MSLAQYKLGITRDAQKEDIMEGFQHIPLWQRKKIGRYLKTGEMVHHLDMNRSNNALENLCIMNKSQHLLIHRALGEVGIKQLAKKKFHVIKFISNEGVRTLVKRIYIDCDDIII